MLVSLGRVVGSKIRNGNTLPTNFEGWLDGDIFILNSGKIPYYEYISGELIERGQLKTYESITDRIITSSEAEKNTYSNSALSAKQGYVLSNLAKQCEKLILTKDDIVNAIGLNPNDYNPTIKDVIDTIIIDFVDSLSEHRIIHLIYEDGNGTMKEYLVMNSDNKSGDTIITNFYETYIYNFSKEEYIKVAPIIPEKTYNVKITAADPKLEIYTSISTTDVFETGLLENNDEILKYIPQEIPKTATGYVEAVSTSQLYNIYAIKVLDEEQPKLITLFNTGLEATSEYIDIDSLEITII